MTAKNVTVRRLYSDRQLLLASMLDAFLDDILSGFVQTNRNLEQLRLDGFGSDYSIDNDGNANRSNTLFEKQYSSATYSTGSISLGTTVDANYADADTTNLKIDFTPEASGRYRVTACFNIQVYSSNGNPPTFSAGYRLSDHTNSVNAQAQIVRFQVAANGAGSAGCSVPVTLSAVFTLTGSTITTFRLQKKVLESTNIAGHNLYIPSTAEGFAITVEKI